MDPRVLHLNNDFRRKTKSSSSSAFHETHRRIVTRTADDLTSAPPPSKRIKRVVTREADLVQPPMITFDKFQSAQPSWMSRQEFARRYAEYMVEFRRQQLHAFFAAHKGEEWFRVRYHPGESAERREKAEVTAKQRLRVFQHLWGAKVFQGVSVDVQESEKLTRILETVEILLEDGVSEMDPQMLIESKSYLTTDTVGSVSKTEVLPDEVMSVIARHNTVSIFLCNLAPSITQADVEAICMCHPGFRRASLADPTAERRWLRRGWVTFEGDVNPKEISQKLRKLRPRGFEMHASVNKRLCGRIRTASGIAADRRVVRNDIKIAAGIINNLDRRLCLPLFGNPVLENIADYVIEETSSEEMELLGITEDVAEEERLVSKSDPELNACLDRLIFYLRVVHSVDFYSHYEYQNENQMPNRCGVMHVRGIPPKDPLTLAEVEDYCAKFEGKIREFHRPLPPLTDDEVTLLGMQSEDAEVEKFIKANTVELRNGQWLCPLSGKKFVGCDFVRQHIFKRHVEKLEEVKQDVHYFNNYLRDAGRPQLPENPQNKHLDKVAPALTARDEFRYGGYVKF